MKYRINKVNAWNGWDPLRQVILGDCWQPDMFDDVKDPELRDMLQKILYETKEDLAGIKKTLEDLGVDVVQMPDNVAGHDRLDRVEELSHLTSPHLGHPDEIQGLPKPCLTPRDYYITMGDKLFVTTPIYQLRKNWSNPNLQNMINPACVDFRLSDMFMEHIEYNKEINDPTKFKLLGPFKPSAEYCDEHVGTMTLRGQDYNPSTIGHNPELAWQFMGCPQFEPYRMNTYYFWAPVVTRVGTRLIVDLKDISNLNVVLKNMYPNFNSDAVSVGGHNDGVFCLPKPGLVITAPSQNPIQYEKTLPGWDVLRIEHPGEKRRWQEFKNWREIKAITNGEWWLPDAKNNPKLVNFVKEWLYKWVGYIEETSFEVNMLSINENTILSLNYQKDVHDKLKQHKIEPIYCRFRHRNFWDGGLHCLTVDTVRKGGQQEYFQK